MNVTHRLGVLLPVTALLLSVSTAAPVFALPQTDTGSASDKDTSTKEKKARKPAGKPQSELAAKSVTFSTIAAADPSVKKALKATDLEAAKKLDGKAGSFTGTISTVFLPHSNSVAILNFAKDYKTAVSAVVLSKSFSAFPSLTSLEGKTVLITGDFKTFHDQPEIVLTKPTQVKIVK